MRGSRSFRPDSGLDERALDAIASPYRLTLPLVPVDPVLVGDSEATGAARPTASDHDRSDQIYPSGENSRHFLGEAIVVVRLVRTQGNGVDVVVELLANNQNGKLDGPLKPDARHTPDGDSDDELAPHPEHHELADYTLPTPDHDTRTTLRQPHHERSHTHPPRTGRRRGGAAAIIAAAIVLLALVLLRPHFRADIPVSPPAPTPPTTGTPWTNAAQSLTAAGAPTLPTFCASSLPPTGDALCQRWDCPIVCVSGRDDHGQLAAVTRSP
jgi:hypothetical protein